MPLWRAGLFDHRQLDCLAVQFPVDIEEAIFRFVEKQQNAWRRSRDLPGEFRSNAAAGASNQDDFVPHDFFDLLWIGAEFFSLQEIFDAQRPQVPRRDVPSSSSASVGKVRTGRLAWQQSVTMRLISDCVALGIQINTSCTELQRGREPKSLVLPSAGTPQMVVPCVFGSSSKIATG
jgi:hypothetical protein